MKKSLRALLTGIVDYAGLFPPAQLPLDEAIRNYARYLGEADPWMLGRFICAAARLGELSPFVGELFTQGPPLRVSALGRGGNTRETFLAGLDADLQAIADFRSRHGVRVVVDGLETRLPPDALAPVVPNRETRQLIEQTAARIDAATALTLFVEVPGGPHWCEAAEETFGILGSLNAERELMAPAPPPIGFKVRCGGQDPAAVPPAKQVARVVTAGVPFKATAGLHHPFRRDTVHGFVNVFAAGVLAHVHGLRPTAVESLLLDEEPAHFIFEDAGLRWGEWYASIEEIRSARRQAALSFGSCSFEEPRDDLRRWVGFDPRSSHEPDE